jgi:LysM repeat protein
MAIKNLPKYKDLRGKLKTKGSYTKYPLSKKTVHVVHHSLTESGSAEAYANYHVGTHGWPGIAYHFVIDKDGTINQTNDLNASSYHVGNSNSFSIGTVLTGDFRKGRQKPTQAQMESLYLLNKELYKEVPSLKQTKAHQEMAGYSWKNCPGDNWNYKKVIDGSLVSSDDKGTSTPSKLPNTYVIQQGDTFWSIAKELEGISVDELKDMNPSVDPTKLQVGQTINLAKTPSGSTYTVRKGDTLWGIARAYKGIEVTDIKKANNLKSDVIHVGDKLVIPTGTSSAPKPKPAPKPAPKPSYIGKRVEAKVNLRFYRKPSWEDKDVAGTCPKGLGFTIVDKIKVGGGEQYKVKNSKGSIYYITASSKYVTVE